MVDPDVETHVVQVVSIKMYSNLRDTCLESSFVGNATLVPSSLLAPRRWWDDGGTNRQCWQ